MSFPEFTNKSYLILIGLKYGKNRLTVLEIEFDLFIDTKKNSMATLPNQIGILHSKHRVLEAEDMLVPQQKLFGNHQEKRNE